MPGEHRSRPRSAACPLSGSSLRVGPPTASPLPSGPYLDPSRGDPPEKNGPRLEHSAWRLGSAPLFTDLFVDQSRVGATGLLAHRERLQAKVDLRAEAFALLLGIIEDQGHLLRAALVVEE